MINYDKSGNIACIYRLTSVITHKIYIGQTRSLTRRLCEYRKAFRQPSQRRQKWIREYLPDHKGIDFDVEFIVDVLEEVSDNNKLNERERYWIDKLNSTDPDIGYNTKPGGGVNPNDNNVSSVYKYALVNKSKHSVKGVYVYDLDTDSVITYLSVSSAAKRIGIDLAGLSSCITKGVKIKNRYVLFYADSSKSYKIAHALVAKYMTKVIDYYSRINDDTAFKTQVSHLINRITDYLMAYANVEIYKSFMSELDSAVVNGKPTDKVCPPPYTDESLFAELMIREFSTFRIAKISKVRANNKKQYAEKCRRENIPITSADFAICGNMCPVIVYDRLEGVVKSYLQRQDAAKAIGCTNDTVRSKLNSGASIFDRYYVYYAVTEKREKAYSSISKKTRRGENMKKNIYYYNLGYIKCARLCREKPFTYDSKLVARIPKNEQNM